MRNNVNRRQREKSEMRLRIVDSARELFVSGGESAVTLRRVADQIEYSATTIYLYFTNKEALIREICLADFAVYSRVLTQAERVADPVARLRKVAAAYVDFGLLYPAHYRAMFMTPANARLPGKDRPAKKSARVESAVTSPAMTATPTPPGPYDHLHNAVFKAMAAGCFRPEHHEVALIAQIIWSGLHGVVSLNLVRARYAAVNWRPVQIAAEAMVECLISGFTDTGSDSV